MKVIRSGVELHEETINYIRHMIAGQLKNLRGAPKMKRENPGQADHYDNIIERDSKAITDLFIELKNEFEKNQTKK